MPNSTVIVLDVAGNGITTQDIKTSKVSYDWDGDGLADQTSWIGTGNAFLFLDADGNGTVTDASELSFWPAASASGASTSVLSSFDSNHDGAITTADESWGKLKIWQDNNGNGVVDSGEILTLATAGVRSLAVTMTAAGGSLPSPDGAATLATGSYTRTNGTTQNLAELSFGYFSAPLDGLPTIDFFARLYDRYATKYRIRAKDGQLYLTGKHFGTLDSRAGGISGAAILAFKDRSFGMLSALVVDLDGHGVSLESRRRSRAGFDMNGDGVADDVGWISKSEGFLVIDRNNDGLITGPSELSFLSEDETAQSSLDGLLSLDSNGDKVLDKKDARFGELKIWVDANGDGVTEQGELKTLGELGIVSIDLAAHDLTGTAKVGDNLMLATASFTRANGTIGTIGDAALAFTAGAPPMPVPAAIPADNPSPPDATPSLPTQNSPDAPKTFLSAGFISAAAAQFATAIASFGVSGGAGDLDPRRDLSAQLVNLAAPAPQH